MMGKQQENGNKNNQLKYELLKSISEHNQEVIFQYERESDYAAIYRIIDDKFEEQACFENFFVKFEEYLLEIEEEDRSKCKEVFESCLNSVDACQVEFRYGKGEEKQWYQCIFAPIIDDDKKVKAIAGRIISIHQEKTINEQIRLKAEIDALTGVYNHITFEGKAMDIISGEQTPTLFLMMDVDDFKMINDTLGHNVGDMVLSQTGAILGQTVKGHGFAGRLGGDEFALVAWGFTDSDEIHEFCDELRSNLKNIIFDMEYSSSMGACIKDGRSMTFKDMYFEADQAVYASKKNGKNQITFYDEISNKNKEEVREVKNVIMKSKINEYDRFILDEKLEYIFLIDIDDKKIEYANVAAIKQLGFENFQENNAKLERIEKYWNTFSDHLEMDHENYFSFMTENNSYLLVNVVPKIAEEKKYRLIKIINLSDVEHVNNVMRVREENFSAIKKSMKFLTDNNDSLGQKKALQQLCEFYNADYVAVISYENNEYTDIFEIHKPNAEMIAKIMKQGMENKRILSFSKLIDENGTIILRNVASIKESEPILYRSLVDGRIWSITGRVLEYKGEMVGVFVMLNARHNLGETVVADIITDYLSADLVSAQVNKVREYEEGHDKLTGLLNRKKYTEWSLSYDEHDINNIGIFATDIIFLKRLNREFGYNFGNMRLIEVAEILKEYFGQYDIYRYDADEMLVICPNISKEEFTKTANIVKKVISNLSFAVSTGYSWSTDSKVRVLIDKVEEHIAFDKEKRISTDGNGLKYSDKVKYDTELEIQEGRFCVYLQPKVNLNTGLTVGAEALVRLYQESFGIIGPNEFIKVLEKHNAIHMVDLFVLEEVCKFQNNKMQNNEKIIPISINFSKKTMLHPNLLENVEALIKKWEIPNGCIEIEIAETIGEYDTVALSGVAESLIQMGFVFAMDDFGTKNSNVEKLFKCQFKIAKIDKTLVKELTTNENNRIILAHLIAMIKDLGLQCVVEGAETVEQIDILKELDCDVVQGYYYGKPVPAREFYDKFMNKCE